MIYFYSDITVCNAWGYCESNKDDHAGDELFVEKRVEGFSVYGSE